MSREAQRATEAFQRSRRRQNEIYGLHEWTASSTSTTMDQDATHEEREKVKPKPPEGFALSAESDYHAQYHAQSVRQYLLVSKSALPGGGAAIEVVVADCASAAMVRESLLDLLASQMVNRLVRVDRPEIGDIVFTSQTTESDYLLFTKGLQMIQLRNVGSVDVSVEQIARDLAGGSPS